MTSVMKSPNMMSTTGRMPVIAAPSPSPAIPASEIGESITRSGPNSSTRPESTLNGVPASATSSPTTKTVGSRRSSSASASFTACASEISRVPSWPFGTATLAIDVLVHLVGIGVRRRERVFRCPLDLVGDRAVELGEPLLVRVAGVRDARAEQRERVALGLPLLLLALGPIVGPVDVSDVVAAEAVRVTDDEGRTVAAAGPRDRARRGGVNGEHVLAVDLLGRDPERLRARRDLPGGRLREVRVLVVEVVLAD